MMAHLPPRETAANKAHLMSLAIEVLRTRDDIDEWDIFQHLTDYLREQDKHTLPEANDQDSDQSGRSSVTGQTS